MPHRIIPTTARDQTRAVASLVTAFAADPAVRWTFPGPRQYLDHFADFVGAFGGNAFAHGTGEALDGFEGAALWLSPQDQPDEAAIAGVLEAAVEKERLPEVFSLLEQMGKFHPTEPHWYLPLIGVDPGLQGRGCGTQLLEHGLQRCDRELLPAYLESTNPRNVTLYERFGFKPVGKIQTQTSPPIIPMWREPQ